MKCQEIFKRIEKRIPKSWAEEWDNPGLAVSADSREIDKIALALDATPDNVIQASEAGAGRLFTHHPLIFRPLKKVTEETFVGRTVIEAIKRDITIYSAHTNWDSSPEGVNFVLAAELGLTELSPLVPAVNGGWGLGVTGRLAEPLSMEQFAKLLSESWQLTDLTCYGDGPVSLVAAGGGSCGEFWREAKAAGADIFITADMGYHLREEALDEGLAIALCDHGEMERASLKALSAIIESETELPVVLLDEKKHQFIRG